METKPSAPTEQTPRVLRLLKRLYRTCIHGERGFSDAARDVESTEHRIVLVRYAEQRAAFADAIAEAIARLGAVVDPTGTPAGELHRGWLDVKRATTGREQPILDECARGEDAAMRRYADAMKSAEMSSLRPGEKRMIEQQYEEIVSAHEHMQRLARSC